MLLLQSDSFVNLNAFSLQNDASLVSNKHLISFIGVYLKLSLEIMACRDERISEESDRYSIFELSKYGLIFSKCQALRTRFSP